MHPCCPACLSPPPTALVATGAVVLLRSRAVTNVLSCTSLLACGLLQGRNAVCRGEVHLTDTQTHTDTHRYTQIHARARAHTHARTRPPTDTQPRLGCVPNSRIAPDGTGRHTGLFTRVGQATIIAEPVLPDASRPGDVREARSSICTCSQTSRSRAEAVKRATRRRKAAHLEKLREAELLGEEGEHCWICTEPHWCSIPESTRDLGTETTRALRFV